MKKFVTILLLLTISFFAFTSFKVSRPSIKKRTIMIPKGDDYASQWKEIVAFDQKRLPKSALEVVNNILQKAQQTNNGEQIIKALFYKARYEQSLKENSFNQTLTLFKEEAEKANPTNRSIIYSIIAEQYWSYYQNNRWQIQKRTHTDGVDETDIKTWDIRKIIEATTKYYLLSLENVDNLSRTPINAYTEIITQGKDFDQNTTEKIRPFLYDFLSHRAIDFFINEEPNITQAKETFRVDDEDYFALGKTFVNKNIVIKDSSNLKNYGIILLQKLIKTHLYDEDKTALISVELKRLYFVKNNSVLPNNDELYYNALTTFLETYKSSPSSTEIIYKIALVHFNNSKKYNLKQGLKYKDENKKVLELCRQAFAISENNFGSQQCKTLIDKVKEKTLSIKTEAYVSSAKVRKALISYKNIDKVYFKLIKVDFDKYSTWLANRTADNKHKFIHEKLLSISPEKTWSTSLKDDKDFNSHSTEILIEALQKGHYVLLTSNNEKFEYTNATFQYSSIMVTNISYVSRKINNSTKEFFVTDRETGKPLSDVSAKLFIRYYDYKTRKYKTINKGTFKTNTKGMFKVEYPDIKINKHGSSFYIVFTHKDDILNTSSYSLYPHHKQTTPAKTTTFFYTDRAIYRPGQTVYFKGIVIEKQGDKSTLKTDYKTTVEFVDVNWQKIKSLELTTNEYGSFSGSFVTPDDRLNGMMTIKNSNGSIRISVEEYKRPQFEVEIKPITGTYKLDENVSIKGFAKTYSGAALDGADVTYRVIRNANFPYWVWYRWGYMPTSPEVEIINGTSKTNDKGEFEINFLAQSDKTVSNKFSPTFTYTVYVDIIDVNGETHSANSFVRVSEKALLLSTNIKQKLLIKDFEEIKINSTNLNGEFESTKVKVAIWALQEPKNYFIKRKWQAPEYQTLSKEEFKKNFPYENYADEHLVQNWKKESKVLDKIIFTTKDKNTIKINKENFSQGNYFLKLLATDKYGKEVVEEKYFRIIDSKNKKADSNIFFELIDIKTTCKPGEKASFMLSTSSTDLQIYYEIEYFKTKKIIGKWLTLSNEQKRITIPVKENDRGNFAIHIVGVKYNRSFAYTKIINVPHLSKNLNIEFSTFRDKLLPGQDEEWEIKIKGPKGEKVVAEMMAGMYDASLDAFKPNSWNLNTIQKYYYSSIRWETYKTFNAINSRTISYSWNTYSTLPSRSFCYLNTFGYRYINYRLRSHGVTLGSPTMLKSAMIDEGPPNEFIIDKEDGMSEEPELEVLSSEKIFEQASKESKNKPLGEIKARTNFNETAFFFPHLSTDAEGNVSIKFTIPESLTKWKFMALAHTKDLKTGTLVKEVITQKDLMVYPNAPRFFRENDEMVFSTKIVNISDKDLHGEARIYFFNSLTNEDVTKEVLKGAMFEVFKEGEAVFPFTLPAEKSTVAKWKLKIPESYSALTYKVVAKAGNFSDGEEKPIPVLTNRMLVTESMPLPIRGHQSKTFTFNKLINNKSTTLKNHKLTLEFTSNPAWYAVQALPYLMEYPYDCAEQTFSRYYANSIASNIANSSPKIKEVFKSWKNSSPEAFLSNLEKNQELKAVILEETPWVLQAQNESERKKRVGLLFNLNKMSKEQNKALNRLQKMQKPSGGWSWFDGMRESRYITQHIATGLGHLDKLGVKDVREDQKTYQMLKNAIRFLDGEILRDYNNLKKWKNIELSKDYIGNMQIQYLYARSFFPEIPLKNKEAYNYYFGQAKKYWTNKSQYMQAMISLTMNRTGEVSTAKEIIASIKEYSIEDEEMGMYWKSNAGYYWYQAPIETQAMFIEAFAEVTNDQASVESMKVWLLKQKQTQDWKTTKATTAACYALLIQGNDWLANDDMVEIWLGNEKVDAKNDPNIKVEAGTGYFKTSWNAEQIKPEMGTVKVTKKDDGVSWGAMYWQYFEQLDKITPAKTPLSLEKKLFLVKNTDKGEVITPIVKADLKVGDKVRVRVILKTNRNMEYIHLKDMRASGFEPTNVFSGYKYQDGLGYYETTKDASTNFFISWLAKGTYVFEYDLRANIEGDFSNGISSVQCMYAPEFGSHSEGVRVLISGK